MANGRKKFLGTALGLVLSMSGCAVMSDRGMEGYSAKSATSAPSAGADARSPAATPSRFSSRAGGAVTPAVATESVAGTSAIRQTGGVVAESTDAMKRGVDKVSTALTPTPTTQPAVDPTSLANKTKPTPELHLAMARYYEQSRNAAAADQAYQQALKLSPSHLGALLEYARFKDRQGLAQDALAIYQKAAKAHPTKPSVFNDLGLFYARQGKNKEAIEAYEKAIQLKPTEPRYRNNVAMVLVETNQPDKAMGHLKTVYGDAQACYNVGYLLEKKGQLPEAAEYYGRAVQFNPAMQEAQLRLASLRNQRTPVPQVARRSPSGEQAPCSNSGTSQNTPPLQGNMPVRGQQTAPGRAR